MFRIAFAAAAIAAATLAMITSPADAQPRQLQVGQLTCSLSASIGLILGSQKNVNCVFRGQPGEPEEAYTGTMTTIGVDIGVTTGGVIVWTVFADSNRYRGMLAGTYAGATAEASVGAGVGANVLVGGSNHTVTLQPISLQGQLGFDIGAGIGALELHAAQ
ncbi:MAG: DUF992 domain-containing protein [Xanthobacteraceae bacterium]|jgi:hypothetical protein